MVKARSLIVSTCLYKGISKLRISTSKKITMYYCHRDNQRVRLNMIWDTGFQPGFLGITRKLFKSYLYIPGKREVCNFSPSDSFRNFRITGPKEKGRETET